MNQSERRDAGLPYRANEDVLKEMLVGRRINWQLNTTDPCDLPRIAQLVQQLFGASEGAFVNPPF